MGNKEVNVESKSQEAGALATIYVLGMEFMSHWDRKCMGQKNNLKPQT